MHLYSNQIAGNLSSLLNWCVSVLTLVAKLANITGCLVLFNVNAVWLNDTIVKLLHNCSNSASCVYIAVYPKDSKL